MLGSLIFLYLCSQISGHKYNKEVVPMSKQERRMPYE